MCACCGTRPGVVAAFGPTGVSTGFTDLHLWADPHGTSLCEPCAANYRNPVLRQEPHWTADRVTWHPADRAWLRATLAAPLDRVGVTIPVRRRKHVWHHTQLGAVGYDDGTITWGDTEAAAYRLCVTLRAAGLSEAGLTEPDLRFTDLRAAVDRATVLDLWQQWRATTANRLDLQQIAVRASRPPLEAP